MSDSPWNAKRKRRAAPRGIEPQSSRVSHVPLRPPLEARPQARMARKPAAKPEPLVQAAREEQSFQEPRQKGRRKPSVFFLLGVFALLIGVMLSAIHFSGQKGRHDALVQARELEAQRVLAEKNEHLNARQNSGYLPLIEKYAKEFGVNPSFVSAIIKCESSFRSGQVRSSVGAMGLMQIMPNTGSFIAGKLNISNYTQESLDDPDTNIRFGTYYLGYLSNMFQGSPIMVASAYHAGDSNAKLWALRHGEDQKTIRIDQIPTSDTRDYVGKVMKAYAIYYEKDQGSPAGAAFAVPALNQP